MMQLELLQNNPLFHTIKLNKGSVLFEEGEINNNIYFIISGKVLIEKYSNKTKTHTKTLSVLGANEFFGEGSLHEEKVKEVNIRAHEDTILIYIDGKKDFEKFAKSYPNEGYEILKYIIIKGNERLLSSNKEVTINYEINRAINSIEKIDYKNIFMLIDFIRLIIGCSYILYIEKNDAIDNAYQLRYDSRLKGKLQDNSFFANESINKEILRTNQIYVGKFNAFIKLSIWKFDLGYLIFGNNVEPFQKEIIRLFEGIATSITGLLRQRKILSDERNKMYLKQNI